MKVHAGDMVMVIRGADRGQTGKVIKVDHARDRVVVEGVNMVYKHVRPSRRNPQGGRLHMAMPIPASNVMVMCPKTNKPTKVGFRYADDGSKERFSRRSGATIDTISPPKARYAKTKSKRAPARS